MIEEKESRKTRKIRARKSEKDKAITGTRDVCRAIVKYLSPNSFVTLPTFKCNIYNLMNEWSILAYFRAIGLYILHNVFYIMYFYNLKMSCSFISNGQFYQKP